MSLRLTPIFSSIKTSTISKARPTYVTAGRRIAPLLATFACGSVLVFSAVSDKFEVSRSWENTLLLYTDSAAKTDLINDPKSKPGFRMDPDTDISFPLTIPLTTECPPLTLVGLGVRTVSFLKIKVYSAGFYLQEGAARRLLDIPEWNTFTAQHLLTPSAPSKTSIKSPQLSGEALMDSLLNQGVACAVRIVPNRNTDFGHLRDAFTRSLLARQKMERGKGLLTEDDEQRIYNSIQTFKQFFPSQSIQKGKSIVILRPPEGGIIVEFEDKVLGKLNDPWIGKNLMLSYFADQGASSEKLKEDVANGLERLIRNQR
ncbi:hypothetical protein L204_102800 [Cryptococcus depauperatus]